MQQHKTESVLDRGSLAIYSRHTDGETGGITDSQSEFVFTTEPTERGCHGDGCYEEAVQISLLAGQGCTGLALWSQRRGPALSTLSSRLFAELRMGNARLTGSDHP